MKILFTQFCAVFLATVIVLCVATDIDRYGKALPIVQLGDDKQFVVNNFTLIQLKNDIDKLKDYKVAVFASAGSPQLGKSSFMNYCLRFLYANMKSIHFMSNTFTNRQDWYGTGAEPLKGFSLKSPKTQSEKGLFIWSDIFFDEEKKIAVLIVDSQGSLDAPEMEKLLTLNSLLSTFMIFNVDKVINQQQIGHFKSTIEYAALTKAPDAKKKFLQTLLLLVRDVKNQQVYGAPPGNKYWIDLVAYPQKEAVFAATVNGLVATFNTTYGFLMPDPVSTTEMGEIFKKQSQGLINALFNPTHLAAKVKRIGEKEVTFEEFYAYLETLCDSFQSDAKAIHERVRVSFINRAINKALDDYNAQWSKTELELPKSVSDKVYETRSRQESRKLKAKAVENFKSAIGAVSDQAERVNELEKKIDESFDLWLEKKRKFINNFNISIPRIDSSSEEDEDEHESVADDPHKTPILPPTGKSLLMTIKTRERTFIMCKPDGVQRGLVGEIIKRFEAKGLKLVAMKFMLPSRELLKRHYAQLSTKSFFSGLITYMSSGPVVPMVWEGENAVKSGRMMLGETKPNDSAPGTIRGDFGMHVGRNIVHGSDTVENAKKEIDLWFSSSELVEWKMSSDIWLYE